MNITKINNKRKNWPKTYNNNFKFKINNKINNNKYNIKNNIKNNNIKNKNNLEKLLIILDLVSLNQMDGVFHIN